MEKIDLTLVSIGELFDEISSRSDFYVSAYQLKNESGKNKTIYTHWQDDAWFGNLALVAALQADILNESYKNNKNGD